MHAPKVMNRLFWPSASLQVVEVNMKVEEPGPDNPHNNAFYAEETLLRSELQAQRDCNALSHRHWIVSSPFVVNSQVPTRFC